MILVLFKSILSFLRDTIETESDLLMHFLAPPFSKLTVSQYKQYLPAWLDHQFYSDFAEVVLVLLKLL